MSKKANQYKAFIFTISVKVLNKSGNGVTRLMHLFVVVPCYFVFDTDSTQ